MKRIFFIKKEGMIVVLVLSLFYPSIEIVRAQIEMEPVKINVHAQTRSVIEGNNASVELMLTNAKNKTVKAPKDLMVEVEVLSPSGTVEKQKVSFKVGEGSKSLQLPLKESGIAEIRATQKELLNGSTFIRVKPSRKLLEKVVSPASRTEVLFESQREIKKGIALNAVPKLRSIGLPTKKETEAGVGIKEEEQGIKSRDQYISEHEVEKKIALRYSPQRRLLADGNDTATIYAFLVGEEDFVTQRNINVRLFNNNGALIPKPLVISAGQDNGFSTLTSNEIGNVTVEYLGSTPKLNLEGEGRLEIPFGPPITNLDIIASPPVISLEDKADIVVRLVDNRRKAIATDKPIIVSFTIDKGQGKIEQKEITISGGNSEGRTQFSPTNMGQVYITAAAPNMLSKTVPIRITFPVMLLLLSGIGGLIGGLIKLITNLGKNKFFTLTVLIGLFTGPLLYWATTVGVISLFPNLNVLNLLSAFFISMLGGWVGTKVFSLILRNKS